MEIDVATLGRRLTQLRELRSESVHSLAARAGVAKSYLAKLERGEVTNPGLQTLQSIAEALHVTLADLLTKPHQWARSPEQESVRTALAEYERLMENLAPALREFLETWERAHGEKLPADVVRSLAQIEFRGRRPRTAEDWRFIYHALMKTME